MVRFQTALKSHLNRQIDKLKMEIQELVRIISVRPPLSLGTRAP
jgi:hypothetical protein